MTDEHRDDAWGFLRQGRPHGPDSSWLQESASGIPPEKQHRNALVAIAITAGLAIGACALYMWQRSKSEPAPLSAPASAHIQPERVAERKPRAMPVWVPVERAQLEGILQTARWAVRLTTDPTERMLLTWGWNWKGVRCPMTIGPDDHPSVAQAVEFVRSAIEAAQAELADTPATPTPRPDADDDGELVRSLATEPDPLPALTCEVPRPGNFYLAREGDVLTGDAGIATGALICAGLEAGCAQGWEREEIEARAMALASRTEVQAAYAEVLGRSEFNAPRLASLTEGTRVWLPPLRLAPLVELGGEPKVTVETSPWPDGTSKLEPPAPALQALAPTVESQGRGCCARG